MSSTPLHPAAARGFASGTDAYVRGRPDYPAEIQNWLTGTLLLGPGKRAVDLGAGTGKFTPRLVQTGADVIAIEPVDAMRERLRAALPGVEALAGTAEAMPLPDESVDAVVCAQSFHWFATKAALRDIHRILKPGGRLGLVWNHRDDGVGWVARLNELVARYEGDAPRAYKGEWRKAFPAEGFAPLERRDFAQPHSGPSEDVIVARVLSTSFIAAMPAGERDAVAAEVRALIAAEPDLAGQQQVTVPYRTEAYSAIRL